MRAQKINRGLAAPVEWSMIHNVKSHFGTPFVDCLDTPQTIVIAVHLPQLPRLDYRQACESLSRDSSDGKS